MCFVITYFAPESIIGFPGCLVALSKANCISITVRDHDLTQRQGGN